MSFDLLLRLSAFRFNPRGTHYYCADSRDAGECRTEPVARMSDTAHLKDPNIHKHITTAQHSGMQENVNVIVSFLLLISIREARIYCAAPRGARERKCFFPFRFFFQSEARITTAKQSGMQASVQLIARTSDIVAHLTQASRNALLLRSIPGCRTM